MSKNLWVVGDSTLSSFEDKYYLPRYGYGRARNTAPIKQAV